MPHPWGTCGHLLHLPYFSTTGSADGSNEDRVREEQVERPKEEQGAGAAEEREETSRQSSENAGAAEQAEGRYTKGGIIYSVALCGVVPCCLVYYVISPALSVVLTPQ